MLYGREELFDWDDPAPFLWFSAVEKTTGGGRLNRIYGFCEYLLTIINKDTFGEVLRHSTTSIPHVDRNH